MPLAYDITYSTDWIALAIQVYPENPNRNQTVLMGCIES